MNHVDVAPSKWQKKRMHALKVCFHENILQKIEMRLGCEQRGKAQDASRGSPLVDERKTVTFESLALLRNCHTTKTLRL